MGATRLYGVGRSAFLLFQRHKFHPAFRTISRVIGYYLGMHWAGVLLHLFLLMLDLVRTMRVLCDHSVSHRQYKCARDYGCNMFSHFVWL